MSEHFGIYSQYYDLLYQDKDYAGETRYLHQLLSQHGHGILQLLEFGCGTGRHAELLVQQGYQVSGIEISPTMLAQAQMRAKRCCQTTGEDAFRVLAGDIRECRLNETFDAVLSVFHVISYQVSNIDVTRTLANVAAHLRVGGLFIFDVWYGPAVLTDRPSVRVKRMENDRIQVTRIAEPELDTTRNCVDVNFTVFVQDKQTGAVQQFQERHPMRYYFTPELHWLAEQHGMRIIHAEEWLTGGVPSDRTWGVCFVACRE